MKFIQTDNQIQIRMSGGSQIFVGAIFTVAGLVISGIGIRLPDNSYTQTTSTTFTTTTTSPHARIFVTLFGLIFLAVGILVAVLAKNRITTIVRGGDVTLSAKRLLGGHQVEQSFPVSDVASVRLNTFMEGGGPNAAPQRESTLQLVLRDNGIVDVASKGGGGFTVNGMNVSSLISRAPLLKQATAVSEFLGVPLQDTDMGSIGGIVNTAREVIANRDAVEPMSAVATPAVMQQQYVANPVPQSPEQTVAPVQPQPPVAQPMTPPTFSGNVVAPNQVITPNDPNTPSTFPRP